MGLADVLEQFGMSYDSEHAWDFADRVFEFVSYVAIDESANLAAERGSYTHFKGSGWSKGMVPIDTIKTLEADRGVELTVDKGSKYKGLNWDALRVKVRNGMRNATLMAVAPNANIGLVAGTTPGIDPRFAQVFSRNKISGKYFDINHNLVNDLKNMGIWDRVKDLIIQEQGDLTDIPGIPQHIKDVYKTSFSTSPYAFIEVAARAQKWVDQGLSRNMYLETRDIGETMDIYTTAWRKGVKTTYYLHSKPRHTAEQSTVRVNKAEKAGQRGFAAVMANDSVEATEAVAVTISEPKAVSAVASFIGPQTSEVNPEPVAQSSPVSEIKSAPVQKIESEPVNTKPAVAPQEKQEFHIMPPSDPQEELLCDSCQ
jgi:ribonucleoside-diphosphate reductase alpha chain